MFFVCGDCRPQLPLPVGKAVGHATTTVANVVAGLPLAGAFELVLAPVGHIPHDLPVVGAALSG